MMDELRRLQRPISASLLAIVLMLGICGLNDPAVAQTAPLRPRDPGLLHVSPTAANLPDAPAPLDDPAWRRSIASHVHLIATRQRLAAILNNTSLELRKTKWYAGFKTAEEALGWLQQNVQVSQVPDTALIQISVAGEIDPADAAKIVRELGNQYIDASRTIATQPLLGKINVLSQMKTRWEAGIRNARNKALENARQLQLDGFGSPRGGGQLEQELAQLTTEHLKAESDFTQAQDSLRTAQETVQRGKPLTAVDRMIEGDAFIRELQSQLAALEIQSLASTTQPALADRRREFSRCLDDALAEKRASATTAYLDSLTGQVSSTRRYLDEVNKVMEKHRTDLAEMSARLAEYLASKDEESGLSEQLRQVQKQLDVLNTMSNQSEMNTIRWASQPGATVSP